MSTSIQLIVGLGNPGPEYAKTRHNAGAWFVERLAEQFGGPLRLESKFKGLVCTVPSRTLAAEAESDAKIFLLIPTTFMNLCGQAVKAIAGFYKIPLEAILVAHDDLDFPPGTVRLKQGGGHGGHNGLRDIVSHMHGNEFYRLRIGIGHPGRSDLVHDYVLNRPSRHDRDLIESAIEEAMAVIPTLLKGDVQNAMQLLHSD